MTTDSQTPQPPRLLKVKEVAAILGESRFTTYRRIERGQLPALRIGSSRSAPLRVDERELDALLIPNKE